MSDLLDKIEAIIYDINELRDGYPDKEAVKRDEALTEILDLIIDHKKHK